VPRLRTATIEERREKILSAAGRIFAEKGYDRTTVRDLEAATGMSRGGIFGHFGGKMALFRAALDQQLEKGLMPVVRAAAPEGESAEETLMAAYRAIAAWHAEHPDAMRMIEQSRLLERTEPELANLGQEAGARRRETVVKNVRDRQARGAFGATIDPWAAAELIQIVMDRLTADAVDQPRYEAEVKAQRIFAVLAAGLEPAERSETATAPNPAPESGGG
jgi:AcrR family transcriptional regulator